MTLSVPQQESRSVEHLDLHGCQGLGQHRQGGQREKQALGLPGEGGCGTWDQEGEVREGEDGHWEAGFLLCHALL